MQSSGPAPTPKTAWAQIVKAEPKTKTASGTSSVPSNASSDNTPAATVSSKSPKSDTQEQSTVFADKVETSDKPDSPARLEGEPSKAAACSTDPANTPIPEGTSPKASGADQEKAGSDAGSSEQLANGGVDGQKVLLLYNMHVHLLSSARSK